MYKNIIFTEKTKNELNKINLNSEQILKVKEIYNKTSRCCFAKKYIEQIYKLYLLQYSTTDIANIFDISNRTVQHYFKSVGLNRTRKECQAIAVKKRDYVKIRKTYKKTMAERAVSNGANGSDIEQYVRLKLSLLLNENLPNEKDIAVVGINTITPVGELDKDIEDVVTTILNQI